MKNIFFLITICCIFVTGVNAQTPQKFNYQAVARDNSGTVYPNKAINIRFTIHDVSATGAVVYQESHIANTDQFGLFTLSIGGGAVLSGTFATINWGVGDKYCQVEMIPPNGSVYLNMGTAQLLSVPFALFAKSVASGDNWGIQNVQTDVTLSGTGTSASPLKIASQGAVNGQVLTWNGSIWIPATISSSSIYILNSSNYLSTTPGSDKIINVQGTITLSATYNNLNNSNLFITGGTFDGNNTQKINFSSNCVISGVNFNNIQVDGGNNLQFINCKFTNVTSLPFGCSLTGCQINNSTFTTVSSIGYIDNALISNSIIPRVDRISNSLIANSTLGGTSFQIELMTNNTINNSTVNILGNFTGNNCDETRVLLKASLRSAAITGNNFMTGTLSNFIDVDLTSPNRFAVNISNNNFTGNTSFPSSNYIRVFGSYTGTRSITKISNNNAIGGTGTFILSQYTGSADLMVNDNDLLYTGGLGVSAGGFISVRNNVIH